MHLRPPIQIRLGSNKNVGSLLALDEFPINWKSISMYILRHFKRLAIHYYTAKAIANSTGLLLKSNFQ